MKTPYYSIHTSSRIFVGNANDSSSSSTLKRISALNVVFYGLFFPLFALALIVSAFAQIGTSELVAPKFEISGGNLHFTVLPSVSGRTYQLQWSDSMADGTWSDLEAIKEGDGNELLITTAYQPTVPRRFYRLALGDAAVSEGFALIPAGIFQMGDQSNPPVGYANELPVHGVNVSEYYMGKYEVTKELWDSVRAWGLNHGYTDLAVGNGNYASKGASHPVHSISWFDTVKWCNARSEMEGLTPCYTVSGGTYMTGQSDPVCNWSASGYRLPSEAEWEMAARGGRTGLNFPWGDMISHSDANFWNYGNESYQTGTTGSHPTYGTGSAPYSSPVGRFAPNGYGLYDMAGNIWEWCWDWHDIYPSGTQTNPHGASSGTDRIFRGGGWVYQANYCRTAHRGNTYPAFSNYGIGFRVVRKSAP